MQNEIDEFLKKNEKTNYYNYIHRGNGIIMERQQYLLNCLLQYILEGYIIFKDFIFYNEIGPILEEVLKEDFSLEEKINFLKIKLFFASQEVYDKVICLVEFLIYKGIKEIPCTLEKEQSSLEVTSCIVYLMQEIETLMNSEAYQRAM